MRKDGTVELDKRKIAAEERLDGKYLIKTSDDTLSLSDIVLGYKQLHDIERGFRTLKSELELRPVYHRKSERLRAHVLICWLALLLIRIAENETGMTWFNIVLA
jgi:transposase